MMLDLLGEAEAAAGIVKAIEATLVDKALRTPDLGGTATTATAGRAIANALASHGR
jgi:tartrate dehydrogenase/decarboxylase/D-malate dehydrogenase